MFLEIFRFSPCSPNANLCKESYKFICANLFVKPILVVPQLFDTSIFLHPSASNLEGTVPTLVLITAVL